MHRRGLYIRAALLTTTSQAISEVSPLKIQHVRELTVFVVQIVTENSITLVASKVWCILLTGRNRLLVFQFQNSEIAELFGGYV
jgi:hypothetical protein